MIVKENIKILPFREIVPLLAKFYKSAFHLIGKKILFLGIEKKAYV